MITVLCNNLEKYPTTLTLSMNNVCAFKKILEKMQNILVLLNIVSLMNGWYESGTRVVGTRGQKKRYKRPKEKIQKDKQLSTKHTYKTKD